MKTLEVDIIFQMSNHNELSNVIICDDHFVSLIGIEMLLGQYFPYPLNIRKATTGKKAIELFTQKLPDLMVIDLGLPDISGIEVVKKIRETSITPKIIVLTGMSEPHLLRQVYQLKVSAILRKMNSGKNLEEALNFLKTKNGNTYLDPSTQSILEIQEIYVPTRREYEVLELMSKGFTSEEIAGHLKCSIPTIKTYRARIMDKSSTRNSAEMISWFLKGHGK